MKAVRIHQHGGREQLRFEDVTEPQSCHGEVIVRLKACALNYRDIEGRVGFRGVKKLEMPLPQILGADGAGVVVEVGEGVQGVKIGDEVLLTHVIGCGHCYWCVSGKDHYCPAMRTIGIHRPGTYAQYTRAPRANVIPKPPDLTFEEASCLALVLLTCWPMMVTRGRVQAGEEVLVHAAGSGIGTMAIQIAKAYGARVVTTGGTKAKLQRAIQLGADEVINYREKNFVEEATRLTDGRGVDLVVDPVGGQTLVDSIKTLAQGGRLVTCASGSLAGDTLSFGLSDVREKRVDLIFSFLGSKAELLEALKLVKQGKIKPVIHQILSLEDAAVAHQMLEERQQFGKIVLAIP